MGISVKIKGLDKLQRKLEEMPSEIERIRRDILAKYAAKIERESIEACPTAKLKESIKLTVLPNGNFSVHCSEEAKPFVNPVIERNKAEMAQEMKRRIGTFWKS